MQRFTNNTLFSFLFSVFLITLPFSKGVMSVAYVGLLLLAISTFFKEKLVKQKSISQQVQLKTSYSPIQKLLLAPLLLFITLLISLLYTENLSEGFDRIISQSKLIGIPFICYVYLTTIQANYNWYLNLLTNAVTLAAFLTFIFFLLPASIVQSIADTIKPLKDYVLHEKQQAFGAYSPFIDRLQFSYLIGGVFFLELGRLFQSVERRFAKPQRFSKRVIVQITKLVLLFLTLLILGARGAQIGFILGSGIWLIGIYYYYIYPFLQKRIGSLLSHLIIGIGLLVSTVYLPLFAYKKIPAVTMRYDQMMWELGTFQDGTFKNYEYVHFTSIRRLLSWQHSWTLVQQQPILGVGIGDYSASMHKVYSQDDLGFPVNTQSQFLYYWVSAGLLGIGSFLLVWGYWLLCLIQRQQYWVSVLAASFFVFYSFIFLLDAPLNFQVGAMTFWLFYALIGIFSFRDGFLHHLYSELPAKYS